MADLWRQEWPHLLLLALHNYGNTVDGQSRGTDTTEVHLTKDKNDHTVMQFVTGFRAFFLLLAVHTNLSNSGK